MNKMTRLANRKMPNFGLLTHQCHPTDPSHLSPKETVRITSLIPRDSGPRGLPVLAAGTYSSAPGADPPNTQCQAHRHIQIQTYILTNTAPPLRPPFPLQGPHDSLPPPCTASRPHRAMGRDWEGVPHHLQPVRWGWGECHLQVPSRAGSLRENGGGMGSPPALLPSSAVGEEGGSRCGKDGQGGDLVPT